jgi:cytochrome bd-type quinol oxidase subunit 2
MTRRWLAALTVFVALGGIFVVFTGVRRGGLAAFLGSCEFLLGTIGASAASRFPVMLRATGGDALSMTAYRGRADEAGVRTALRWFLVGLSLALACLVVVFRLHRGKAVGARDGEGY